MPVYEYACSGCKKVFEMQQRLADAPVSACPECGSAVKKLISMSSFQLKGGGWHTDGYSAQGKGSPCAEAGSAPSCPDAGSAPSAPSCPGAGGAACCQCPAAE